MKTLYKVFVALAIFLSVANVQNVLGQAAAISYASPQTYTEGTAITALTPTNTGGTIPVAQQAVSTLASAINGQVAYNPSNGNLYVADKANNVIRQITAAGVVTVLAGSGSPGFVNGTGIAASFNAPTGICISGGAIYVADAGNNVIRKITIAGVVTTFAGSGAATSVDGTATAGSLNSPIGLTVSASSKIYVLEKNIGKIRIVQTTGAISTLTTNTLLNADVAITLVTSTNLFYVTGSDNIVKSVNLSGTVTTVAGTASPGSANGTGTAATFSNPTGIVADKLGNLYVADSGNNLIRYITLSTNAVTTFAGSVTSGSANGLPASSTFKTPVNIALNYLSNFTVPTSDLIFISDDGNNSVRKIATTGYSVSPALPSGLSLSATTGTISGTATAVAGATNYTVSAYNSGGTGTAIVNIAIANSVSTGASPKIYTIAGNRVAGHSADGLAATTASLNSPYGIARDKTGNLYIIGYSDNFVRKIDAVTNKMTTIAGTATGGFSGDGGPAVSAQLNYANGGTSGHRCRRGR